MLTSRCEVQAYDVFGKAGPPVVLIHGWSGSRHYFERNAQVPPQPNICIVLLQGIFIANIQQIGCCAACTLICCILCAGARTQLSGLLLRPSLPWRQWPADICAL